MFFYYYPKGILKKNPVNVYEIPTKFNIDEDSYSKLVNNLYETIKLLRKEFENESKANDYMTAMFLTDYLFGGLSKEHYKVLLISKTNYPIFFNSKNVDEYIEFLNQ